ncbi:MAG: hypothetical protein GY940_23270 [bacterium]|nr:hypothetical protein [bacterium]
MRKRNLPGLLILCLTLMFSIGVNMFAAGGNGSEPASYMMIYQVNEYDSKVGDAINYFFEKVLKSEDSLVVFSPLRPYQFSSETRKKYPLKKLIARTRDVLKKDISISSGNFRNIETNMEQIVRQLAEFMGTATGGGMSAPSGSGSEIKSLLTQYRQLIDNYRGQRKLKGALFTNLAKMLKPVNGRKYIYLFYDKTFRTIPDKDTMSSLRSNPGVSFLASEAFVEENTSDIMDTDKVVMALKDSGVIVNFIYIKKQKRRREGYAFNELSGDMYSVLSKIAHDTGGVVETSSKPAAALKKAAAAK